ncbi:Siderophore-interacting FAD-binding domain protein [Corynebacterium efficiens YS-314]|uniref:FAD-binding FR-type domain-containing protein n=1 Tax=Corynebacterium efficiens (strain DSM 44549 / YS-314 / AJ 12310 / JCM 11189 / NBRC 100395) TaxID=196164 RepID=Q8FRS6_COREF|nr:siderophore-interacting protein [Corynebacterium efficiens]EEW50376.1 Siderophore-interacting FAD-binding domain protein [Corynebacterium efficiens YS-314]BAC17493.1 conserved hypothetical protein [Corynebacterium efficiens YS-314]
MNTTTRTRPTHAPVRAAVVGVDKLSAHFTRITFTAPGVGTPGTPIYDQRIKLIFPVPGHPLPDLTRDWYASWCALPEDTRGVMRTYSIRALDLGTEPARLTVDFVLHPDPGPAAAWAEQAAPGQEIILVAPQRGADPSGIEFAPGAATDVVLAGDETAAPAIARILEDLGPDITGVAFIEIPTPDDLLPIDAPPGMEVRWLPRAGAAHGTLLTPAVLGHLGVVLVDDEPPTAEPAADLVWETPGFSSLGEQVPQPRPNRHTYHWIAGESSMVTRLRRALVKDHGLDRSQVAFMGYWRQGVAMRG